MVRRSTAAVVEDLLTLDSIDGIAGNGAALNFINNSATEGLHLTLGRLSASRVDEATVRMDLGVAHDPTVISGDDVRPLLSLVSGAAGRRVVTPVGSALDAGGELNVGGPTTLGGALTVSGTTTLSSLNVSIDLKLKAGLAVDEFSGDVGLGANSDQAVPTQKAVKTYVDRQIISVNQALATKAMLGGSSTQDFQARTLTVGGLTVNGNIAVIGMVDGRDVSADGTRLDQIDNELSALDTRFRQSLATKAGLGGSPTQDFQVQNLSISGRTAVANGVIQCGGSLISTTSDLGLYSQVQGQWVRFVTNKGQFRFYADSGAGTSALLTITAAGDLGIGTDVPHCKLDVEGDIRINDRTFWLRGAADTNHGLGWYGPGKLFANTNPDGPVLFGCSGGALGTVCGGQKIALSWNNAGKLTVAETIYSAKALCPHVGVAPIDAVRRLTPSRSDSKLLLYDYDANNWAGIGVETGGSIWIRIGVGTQRMAVLGQDGGLYFGGGASCDGRIWWPASSRAYKQDVAVLSLENALATVAHLDPVTFRYTDCTDEEHIGFIAEDVPTQVASSSRTSVSLMGIVGALTRVVQHLQQEVAGLQASVKREHVAQ
jgi:hypothetical protein